MDDDREHPPEAIPHGAATAALAPLVGASSDDPGATSTYVFRMTSPAIDRQGEVITLDGPQTPQTPLGD